MTHPYGQNIVACIWDFDKTLIPGYMQTPLFEYYNINESVFWEEVNKLPEIEEWTSLQVVTSHNKTSIE